jgi:hypothetical protein
MILRFRFLAAGLFAMGLLAPFSLAWAQPDSAAGTRATASAAGWQRLLQATCIEQVLREMPNYYKQGFEQAKAQGAPISAEAEAALKAAADEVLAFDGLQRAATDHLQASLKAEQLAELLAFYSTPVGRKLSAADSRAASPEFQRLLMERAPKLMETLSQDTGRLALLQSWLQATQAVEQATNTVVQGQLALEWGLISTLPPGTGKPGFEELKNQVNSQRFGIQAMMAQMTLVHAAVAYQDFSPQELGQMLQIANSPAGQALHIHFSRLLHQTLVSVAESLGKAAGRRLAQKPA